MATLAWSVSTRRQESPAWDRDCGDRLPQPFNEVTSAPVARTVGVSRCDQPRALDLAAQHGRRLETVPEPIMDEVVARLGAILT